MRRITADEVVEAYKKTNLVPVQGEWYATNMINRTQCACALTTLTVAKDPSFLEQIEYRADFCKPIQETIGISYEYLDGFTHGFDGARRIYENASEVFITGYRDGEAAWKAVKEFN